MKIERRAARRLQIEAIVPCRVPATPIRSTVKNLSTHGCMIQLDGRAMEVGATVILNLSGTRQAQGRVIWARAKCAGIKFERSVEFSVVTDLATSAGQLRAS